ncbi:MAG: ribosome recycling factor [Candidatus Portnoybacteria bacterium CG03_land_8_20_14_0_80_41_10]|uniref:Ribosome-recycling factor n=1 Tax=Candidatus Portnoybacteria bacterium CG03_land_8_20_14_0_80_41_10 TaxID=1974808 RepID=A0A2M7BUG6_9BACT|nr:MAG: ribosome recycling factor [Candidatus Portnoybacteria bacterium CG03_land_8_20_14_0_80_41_10]
MSMSKELIDKIKPNLDKTTEYLKGELASLQIGRATPSLIEDLTVECYNQKMPLKQLANIQTLDSRSILIQPWDKSILKNIEKALGHSKLGLSPVVEEDFVRLTIPPLSEERRKELNKIVQEKMEECRISIRRQREEIWRRIQDLEKEGKISEDDKFKAKDELQKVVDDYNRQIEEAAEKKEKEIMKV